jgi:hypothetical protein
MRKGLISLFTGGSVLFGGGGFAEDGSIKGPFKKIWEEDKEIRYVKDSFPDQDPVNGYAKYPEQVMAHTSHGLSYWQTSDETWERKAGDCVDKSIRYKKRVNEIGGMVDIVLGWIMVKENDIFEGHAWNEAFVYDKENQERVRIIYDTANRVYGTSGFLYEKYGIEYVRGTDKMQKRIMDFIEYADRMDLERGDVERKNKNLGRGLQ